jgi:2-C-methyl-D-erythritol 4-phosphate cytidylyltransferase
MNCAGIIVAAGRGERIKSKTPKQFISISGKTLLEWTLHALTRSRLLKEIIVVLPSEYISAFEKRFCRQHNPLIRIVAGGKRRVDSVKKGLMAVSKESDLVLIHDAARPFIKTQDIQRCIDAAQRYNAAIAAAPASDTVKYAAPHAFVHKTLDRSRVWLVQTPQVFKRSLLEKVFKTSPLPDVTDDAQLVEASGSRIKLVAVGSYNKKITYPEDLAYAKQILKIGTK